MNTFNEPPKAKSLQTSKIVHSVSPNKFYSKRLISSSICKKNLASHEVLGVERYMGNFSHSDDRIYCRKFYFADLILFITGCECKCF